MVDVERLLAAIAETERTIELAGPAVIGWAAYRHENGSVRYCSPVAKNGDVWVTGGAVTETSSVTVVFDPAAVLRRCEVDRRAVKRHSPKSFEGFMYCTTCGSGEADTYPTEWPCADILDLALVYDVALDSEEVTGGSA